MPIVPSRAEQIQDLLARLASERAAVREGAVARLTLLGARAVEPLRAALRAAGTRGQLGILEVLERLGEPRALPEILALVRAAEPEVRRRAVEVAGGFPGPRTATALARVLAGNRPELRRPAAASLARIHAAGALEALNPLLDVLLDEDEDEALRLDVLASLSALPSRTLVPLLERLRGTASAALAARVAALRRRRPAAASGGQELARRVERLATLRTVDEAAIEDLVAHGPPALDRLLERLERTARPSEAERIGQALARVGASGGDRLRAAFERTDNLLAARVLARALAGLRAPASIPVLHRKLELLRAPASRGGDAAATAEARADIHRALAAVGTRIALYDLREMLLARPPRAARALLEVAGAIGEASLAPALAALAHDEPSLLDDCAAAFGAIARREKLRRSSASLRAVRPVHRDALARLWSQYRAAGSR
jgi:HEAT repeat protein